MKRLLSLLLVCAVLLGVCAVLPSAAADSNTPAQPDALPFVLVRGMDFGGLLEYPGTDHAEPALKKLDVGLTIRKALSALFNGLVRRDFDRFTDDAIAIADSMLGKMAFKPDGTPKYDTGVDIYDKALSNYPEFVETLPDMNELGFLKRAVEEYGADKVYYYNYDWRLDPFVHAKNLNALIEQAKQDHGVDKVNLACCSMGGILTVSYLYKYGADSLHRVLFISSTFSGTYVTGDLLNGRVKVYGDLLYNFIVTRMNVSRPLQFLLNILNKMGLFKGVEKLTDRLVPLIKDRVYDTFMRDVFGTMPVVWALTQPEDLDGALDYMFHGKEETYQAIIDLANQYRVMNLQRDDMLKRMQKNGLEIIITASYNLPVVPVYESAYMHGDTVLESPLMLGGATMAPLGETLPDDYKPLDAKYFSADKVVDLSTGLLPDTTWALKDVPHVFTSYDTDCQDLIFWMLNEKVCPTVFSDPRYPQFLQSNDKLELAPLE